MAVIQLHPENLCIHATAGDAYKVFLMPVRESLMIFAAAERKSFTHFNWGQLVLWQMKNKGGHCIYLGVV